MRNNNDGPVVGNPCKGALDRRLCLVVDGERRFIEQQDGRVGEQRPRNRETLSLTTRELLPALANDGVVAVRVLPAPVGPTNAVVCPSGISMVTSSSTGCPSEYEKLTEASASDPLMGRGSLGPSWSRGGGIEDFEDSFRGGPRTLTERYSNTDSGAQLVVLAVITFAAVAVRRRYGRA